MNFLAHFLLSKPTSASRCGNFLGDFVKGTPASLTTHFPSEIIAGIMMHRKIDVFTDSHPSFIAGKTLLDDENRRFAGIVLDIFTDHFLAIHWHEFHELSLDKFTAELQNDLSKHDMPPRARQVADAMFRQNWFQRYKNNDGILTTLTAVSQRNQRFQTIPSTFNDFKRYYDKFELLSLRLIHDAVVYASEL